MKRSRAFLASAASALLLPVIAVVTVETAPATAAVNDQSVSGVASPIWQPNGEVDALETGNGLIYAGGNFTSVKPGSGQSGSTTTRTYIAAFNASDGTLNTAFNVTLNGRVYSLDMSPDNKTLYIGGQFSTVNGTSRNKLAAVNATTGALVTAFAPNPNRPVRSIESTSSTVYLGGDFTTVKNTTQSYLASVTAATGALNTGFAPTFIQRPDVTNRDGTVTTYTPNVLALALAPDGSRLLTGGNFMGVNGVSSGGMTSLDPTTGATEQWDANDAAPAGQPINTNCVGRVSDIVVQGTHAYVTGIGDPPGCYEGTYDATISDGSLNWLSSCLGGSEGLTIMNNIIYKGSHQHDCAFNKGGAYGGFVGGTTRTDFLHRFLVAQNLSDGSFVHWTPNTNSSGSAATGPHAMANDGTQIIVGGDFTTVNKVSQTYLTRFVANGDQATPTVPGRSLDSDPFGGNPGVLTANLAITVQPTKANTLTVLIPTTDDNDSGTLTYNVYRDNGTTPIATMTAESYFWSRPTLRFDDTGLAAGSTHSYRVSASDGIHTSAKSTAVSGTVASSAPAPYSSAIGGLNPQVWWRLDDSGSSLADSSASGANAGTAIGGVTTGQPGAIAGNSAVSLNGTDAYLTSSTPFSAPGAFSESVWFKTDTITGGVLLAQSSIQTGAGGTTDRAIVMDNNGDLSFALAGRGINYRNQTTIWNDGKWHQVVGTYDGGTTISLYVDGQPVGSTVTTRAAAGLASSYLRVGYADMSQLQQLGVFGRNFYQRVWPATSYWQGTVDEATAFDYTLTPEQIQSMFASGVGGEGNQPPVAAFSSTTNHLTASFDATGSSDDSAIASYDWDFGDSTAHGSGATPSHVYASGGTYPVTLTVTDSDGVSRSVSHDVTVSAPTTTTTSTIVPAGSTWSWKYDNTALPTNWNSRTFDASSWNSGAGVLGFGNNVGVVTNIDTFSTTSQRPLTAYFTRQFQVPDASSVVQLTLDTRADDGIVVYVNGTEVGRTNMPSGTIGTGTYASSSVSTANSQRPTYTVPTSLLVNGTNVISAETHLNYRATANATFDLSATITTAD
ncbi:PKD domain-containing protein [Nocardioides mangrovi]|uniref:PKD domain-containing protein n=1 Tax=Nocardioides mangrovi TaxID=2874580 RepID=A0ABS7UF96_9ACTN|nr:PKD domain-containing protein [Nocardioides mangrovi]MBZ5739515.1 PKD domain-containing protein [Nocardioides mangrovi]